jgi:hypothetical protein
MTNPDTALMQIIRGHWTTDLQAAVYQTIVTEPFLAALVANETGGDSAAVRFESGVFSELAEVILGKRKAYSPPGIQHPLVRTELLNYVEPSGMSDFSDCLERLAELATSRGLTQIMGWHAVEMSRPMPGPVLTPSYFLQFTVELLGYFANRYMLDQSKDFAELFRCWNTGKPDGATFDPHYVSNGLARMDLYAKITAGG